MRAIDAPGHGAASEIRADLWAAAELAVETIGRGVYLGYSMGGRIALHAALARPDAVEALVLVSATAGIDDTAERAQRAAADDALATHIEVVGIDVFVDEWLANPLFAGLEDTTTFASERRRNSAAGLASSLRLVGTGHQEPLWDRLAELTMPVLVVAGRDDPKFVDSAARLATAIGTDATLAIIEGAGHSVHLERPMAFIDVLDSWLDARLDQM